MSSRRELIESLSKELHYLDKKDIRYIVDFVFNDIADELSNGNRIEIRGFGSLSIRNRKYSNKDKKYNIIYYRMSSNIEKILNPKEMQHHRLQ